MSDRSNFSTMIRSDFEVDLDYFDDPLFWYSSQWNCDDYRISIDWNDGRGTHGPPKNDVDYGYDPAKRDRYAINGQWAFWDHINYTVVGPYQATITAILHEVDQNPGSQHFSDVHPIGAWPRIPVHLISADSLTVKGGSSNLSGTIILTAPAPLSGTRVLLQVVGLASDGTPVPGMVLPIVQQSHPVYPLNSFAVVVQKNQTVGTFNIITTVPMANVNMIVIASTIGSTKQTATITVTP